MSICSFGVCRWKLVGWQIVAVLALVTFSNSCFAQFGNNGIGFGNNVGGVSVSTEGVLAQPAKDDGKLFRAEAQKQFQEAPAGIKNAVGMRMISLKAIEAALANAKADNCYALPDEVRFLAGIQRLQFVFVYPETRDIVLAGPGEGWKLDNQGNYVGATTGRPVLRLEDLMLAMRTVENARQGGISVSIDPSQDGLRALEQLLSGAGEFDPRIVGEVEKAMGPQNITIHGVPDTSRFARILVASDYQMKRIAMKLEPSPIRELPSFLDLLKSAPKNMMPRWWLACNYEPLGKSKDGLAWELRGTGVKCLSESDLVAGGKVVKAAGKASTEAQRWADTMTANYDKLSAKEPVFGELRNLMDLCVISALITKEGLLERADLKLPTLLDSASQVNFVAIPAPKHVSTQCSTSRRSGKVIITASGGVEINSWQIADRTVEDPAVEKTRATAAPKAGDQLYW